MKIRISVPGLALAATALALMLIGLLAWLKPDAVRPVPTLPPPATAVPVQTVTAAASVPTPTPLLTLTLPAGWQWAATATSGALPALTAAGGEITGRAWAGSAIFDEAGQRLTMAQVPRHGLPLELYLEEVEQILAEDSGIRVEQAELVHDLRADGLPAALLRYVQTTSEGQAYAVIQAALLSPAGRHLAIVTFAGQAEDATHLTQFVELVRTVVFLDDLQP